FNAEGAIDNVAAGKLGSLVSCNSPSPDLVVQIRMINGLARDPPVFQTVDPTIADVGNSHSAPVEMDQSYCRRHCLEGWVVFGHLEDIAVGEVDSAPNCVD